MIVIALGANLPSDVGPPVRTLEAAVAEMETRGLTISARSSWYETPPDPPPKPPSHQPDYVNGVVAVETGLTPRALLDLLLEIETTFGRARSSEKNAPRSLDLDIIAYNDLVQDGPPILPHPRMTDRPFVLLPLNDIAPDWVHPVESATAAELLARLGTAVDSAKRLESVDLSGF